ncbi:hypothetical protein BGW39_008522 [Mortierella sp. 14UC]|nr:hypothetical protein BGW39_008522 [Mortierella sp. 14UC]
MADEDSHQGSVLHTLDQLRLNDGPPSPPPPLPPISSPAPPTCARWYYEMDVERSTELELTYHTIRRKKVLPMTINSRSRYVRWNIPVPQLGTTYLDIVLGVKVRDIQFKAIETVVVTVEQIIGRRVYSRCEVITPRELERLCSDATTTSAFAPHDPDLTSNSDSDSDTNADSGIIKWRLREQLLQSEGVFHAAIEVKTWEGANPDYGTIEVHFVETHSDAHRFYQHDSTYKEHRPYLFSVDMNRTGCPEIDMLMEKPNFVDSSESVDIGDFPPEATAGSGFVRVDVANTCPILVDFAGRAEFHVVAAKDPDPRDELLVTCDGVTIEIYSVFGVWSHVRTIILDPTKDTRSFRRNIYAALFKQLRGKYLALVNAQGYKVSTWDIETGEEVSSCTRFGALEMWALSHVANVSRDGLLITIPGKEHLGIYETTTWNVVGWFRFPGVGRREYVGEGLFIKDDTQIIVAIESDEQPLYRRNRGYIIDIETLKVVDEYVSSGTDIFRALPTKDDIEGQVLLGVGNSSAYAFRLDDRIILPRRSINDDDLH